MFLANTFPNKIRDNSDLTTPSPIGLIWKLKFVQFLHSVLCHLKVKLSLKNPEN